MDPRGNLHNTQNRGNPRLEGKCSAKNGGRKTWTQKKKEVGGRGLSPHVSAVFKLRAPGRKGELTMC